MSLSSTTRSGVLALALACTMAVGIGAARPTIAWGDTLDDLEAKVEQTNDELTAANDKVAQLQQQIDDNQQRISEIEAQLPDARATAAQSIRAQYKMQQGSQGLVELILSSDSFYDFLSAIQFLDSVTSYNTDQIQSLVDLTTELSNTQSDLNSQLSQAETERQNAQDALDSAVAAREALQQQMAEDDGKMYWVDNAEVPEWNFDKITDETSFYLDSDGHLVICFNEGDVAPMYMGCVQFVIPDEVVADIRK